MQTTAGSVTAWYHSDALGSVRVLSNSSAAILNTSSYSAYGTPTFTSGSTPNTHGYAGEQIDPTGLSYNRARYYDATLGRFTQRDTFAGRTNDPLSLNRYVYTQNMPTSVTDPSGRFLQRGKCIVDDDGTETNCGNSPSAGLPGLPNTGGGDYQVAPYPIPYPIPCVGSNCGNWNPFPKNGAKPQPAPQPTICPSTPTPSTGGIGGGVPQIATPNQKTPTPASQTPKPTQSESGTAAGQSQASNSTCGATIIVRPASYSLQERDAFVDTVVQCTVGIESVGIAVNSFTIPTGSVIPDPTSFGTSFLTLDDGALISGSTWYNTQFSYHAGSGRVFAALVGEVKTKDGHIHAIVTGSQALIPFLLRGTM